MGKRTFVIAVAGINHEAKKSLAKRLIRTAKRANADAVKFQLYRAEKLIQPDAFAKARGTPAGPFMKLIRSTELDRRWLKELRAEARRQGLAFGASVFDDDALAQLAKTRPDFIKIASCDANNHHLIRKAVRTGIPVIVSTGLASMKEIRKTAKLLRKGKDALLHCVVEYPAPPEANNLRFIETTRKATGLTVGISDHSDLIETPAVAVALGATIIEKHITFDPKRRGADHAVSMGPDAFRTMVSMIRNAEKLLGKRAKRLTKRERQELVYARRSPYATRDIRRGERITERNTALLRPAIGLPADAYPRLLGTRARRAIRAGMPL